jgi:hypothetical protein
MLLLALVCLLASAIWSAINRAWPFMLLAVGLLLWALSTYPSLTLHL